jgi:prepilin-type N-terminal cleavage/methylation domain-containing protein/prepilin-type processing-associated H-X9-DG protein
MFHLADHRRRGRPAGRGGFTLIELLVVIAIIAILAAILFPIFARAKERALQATCLSNIKQLGYAMLEYCTDWDGTYPWSGGRQGSAPLDAWLSSWVMAYQDFDIHVDEGSLWPYVKDRKVYRCPLDIKRQPPLPLTYVMNDAIANRPQDEIRAPALVIMLLEEDDRSYGGKGANDGRFCPGGTSALDKVAGFLGPRHRLGGNYVYTDGHAAWHGPTGVQDRSGSQLPWSPYATP